MATSVGLHGHTPAYFEVVAVRQDDGSYLIPLGVLVASVHHPLMVYHNGVRMTAGIDYTRDSGNVRRIVPHDLNSWAPDAFVVVDIPSVTLF